MIYYSSNLQNCFLGDDSFYSKGRKRASKRAWDADFFFVNCSEEFCGQVTNFTLSDKHAQNVSIAILQKIQEWNPWPEEWIQEGHHVVRKPPFHREATLFAKQSHCKLATIPYWHQEHLGKIAFNFFCPIFTYKAKDGKEIILKPNGVQLWEGGYISGLEKNAAFQDFAVASWEEDAPKYIRRQWKQYLDKEEQILQVPGQIIYSRIADFQNGELRVQAHGVSALGGLCLSLADGIHEVTLDDGRAFKALNSMCECAQWDPERFHKLFGANGFVGGLFMYRPSPQQCKEQNLDRLKQLMYGEGDHPSFEHYGLAERCNECSCYRFLCKDFCIVCERKKCTDEKKTDKKCKNQASSRKRKSPTTGNTEIKPASKKIKRQAMKRVPTDKAEEPCSERAAV